jgi:hypothetical protein
MPDVPSINLAALEAITDSNVRDVLRAIVDGLNVRNGQVGEGGKRFVTAEELGLSTGRSVVGGNYSNQFAQPENVQITPAQISRIVNDLQAVVIESPLFKALGTRIDLIDKPGGLFSRINQVEVSFKTEVRQRQDADTALLETLDAMGVRVGEAEAGIQQANQFRTNSDNALAQAINTLWSAVGNNSAIVQSGSSGITNTAGAVATNWNLVQAAIRDPQGNIISSSAIKVTAESSVNAIGAISSQYGVRIDSNGYVTGYGLLQTQNGPQPQSEFIVRADRFAIGSPTGPGIAPRVPFIVQTVGSYVQGQYVPPGVYMDMAVIKAASITSAMIGDAEIGTLKLAGHSVTVPQAVSGWSQTAPLSTNWMEVLDMWVDFGSVAPSLVIVQCTANFLAFDGGGDSSILMRVLQDGGASMEAAQSVPNGFSTNIPFSAPFACSAGWHNYKLQVRLVAPATTYCVTSRSMIVLGAKR